MVAVGCEIECLKDFCLLDADEFVASVDSVRLRQHNSVLELFHGFRAGDDEVVRVRLLWKLLELDGDEALSAVPGKIRDSVLSRFEPAEIDPTPIVRHLPVRVAHIESQGEFVLKGSYDFTLYRHRCEVADQWVFFELPTLVSDSREHLVHSEMADKLNLGRTLGKPLKKVSMELRCPFYLFEVGRVETTVYHVEGQLLFLHHVYNVTRANTLAAIVIEDF